MGGTDSRERPPTAPRLAARRGALWGFPEAWDLTLATSSLTGVGINMRQRAAHCVLHCWTTIGHIEHSAPLGRNGRSKTNPVWDRSLLQFAPDRVAKCSKDDVRRDPVATAPFFILLRTGVRNARKMPNPRREIQNEERKSKNEDEKCSKNAKLKDGNGISETKWHLRILKTKRKIAPCTSLE